MSNIQFSKIARRPLAPAFLETALWAIAVKALSVILSLTFSNSKSFLYCFTKAFFGSLSILTSVSSLSSSKVATTGRRPKNSGINPNFIRSSGCNRLNNSPTFFFFWLTTLAPNPITFEPIRRWIMFSRPVNVPPQIKSILEVSTLTKSCWGCFLPPFGGTLAVVPSIILSKACCTPSPETSLVIDGLSDLLAILSISSIYTMPRFAFSTS